MGRSSGELGTLSGAAPPAVKPSALSLDALRLMKGGRHLRLHARPEQLLVLYVREKERMRTDEGNGRCATSGTLQQRT